jgi:hypothetical protein
MNGQGIGLADTTHELSREQDRQLLNELAREQNWQIPLMNWAGDRIGSCYMNGQGTGLADATHELGRRQDRQLLNELGREQDWQIPLLNWAGDRIGSFNMSWAGNRTGLADTTLELGRRLDRQLGWAQ